MFVLILIFNTFLTKANVYDRKGNKKKKASCGSLLYIYFDYLREGKPLP